LIYKLNHIQLFSEQTAVSSLYLEFVCITKLKEIGHPLLLKV